MKVLFLCTYYHRAMLFKNLMDSLEKHSVNIKVFNSVVKGATIDKKFLPIMDDNVVQSECFNRYDRYFFFKKQKKIYKSLVSNFNISDFDCIHAHMLFNGGYSAYKAKKRYGIPYIVAIRNTDMNVFLKIPFFKYLGNRILVEASGIQFVSQAYKKQFIEKYLTTNLVDFNKKSKVIPVGLEPFWLENIGIKKKMSDKKSLRVLTVGKIDFNKNILLVLKALQQMVNEGYEVQYTVVGDILEKKVINEINKHTFVKVLPFQTKEDLIKIYRKNDIFIMPSLSETFGRVYIEAMSQGMPVIYSKGQGIDGFFPDLFIGSSTDSRDSTDLIRAIKSIEEKYEEISQNCITNISNFDWNNISNYIYEMYQNAVIDGGK